MQLWQHLVLYPEVQRIHLRRDGSRKSLAAEASGPFGGFWVTSDLKGVIKMQSQVQRAVKEHLSRAGHWVRLSHWTWLRGRYYRYFKKNTMGNRALDYLRNTPRSRCCKWQAHSWCTLLCATLLPSRKRRWELLPVVAPCTCAIPLHVLVLAGGPCTWVWRRDDAFQNTPTVGVLGELLF